MGVTVRVSNYCCVFLDVSPSFLSCKNSECCKVASSRTFKFYQQNTFIVIYISCLRVEFIGTCGKPDPINYVQLFGLSFSYQNLRECKKANDSD